MRIGIGVSENLPVPVQQTLAQEAEAAGYASMWTNEASGRDALLLCQAWAAATSTLEVGVGVLPIWTRTPAQFSMAIATLQEVSHGRFLAGLGVSHPGTMGPWHGRDVRKPLTAARETMQIIRQLAAGETSDLDGEIMRSRNFRLRITPRPPAPRLYLAAMGPRMLSLAGTRADGVLLNWSTPTEVGRAATTVRASAAAASRETDDVEVATYMRVAVDPDRDAARAALAREVGNYAALPAYADHFRRQGLGDAVEAVKAAYKEGGPEAVPEALDDSVLGRLGWWGTPDDDPAEAFNPYREAQLDHLVARVVVVGDDPAASVRHTMAALRTA